MKKMLIVAFSVLMLGNGCTEYCQDWVYGYQYQTTMPDGRKVSHLVTAHCEKWADTETDGK